MRGKRSAAWLGPPYSEPEVRVLVRVVPVRCNGGGMVHA